MNNIKPFKFFTIDELTHTNTGLQNTPNQKEIDNLSYLINEVLDPLRLEYGHSITVNSGFRSPEVNKKVGGVSTSQHLTGQAADITAGSPEENEKLFHIIEKLGIYDQLINEYNYKWVHVSYSNIHNRKQIVVVK